MIVINVLFITFKMLFKICCLKKHFHTNNQQCDVSFMNDKIKNTHENIPINPLFLQILCRDSCHHSKSTLILVIIAILPLISIGLWHPMNSNGFFQRMVFNHGQWGQKYELTTGFFCSYNQRIHSHLSIQHVL